MGLFDWFKQKRIDKEIEDVLRDVYDSYSDEEIADLSKEAGASREDTKDLLKLKHGVMPDDPQIFAKRQTKLMINTLKKLSDISVLQKALEPPFDLWEAICNDMLHYLAGASVMTLYDPKYDAFAAFLMNEAFGDGHARYSTADIKRCLQIDNLENVIVNNHYTESGADQLQKFCDNWRVGFSKIVPFLRERENVQRTEANLVYMIYQTIFLIMFTLIEMESKNKSFMLITDFYKYVNSCNYCIGGLIPEQFITKEYKAFAKRIYCESEKY